MSDLPASEREYLIGKKAAEERELARRQVEALERIALSVTGSRDYVIKIEQVLIYSSKSHDQP